MDALEEWTRNWQRVHPDVDFAGFLPLARLARLSVLVEDFQSQVLASFELRPRDFEVLAALHRTGRPFALRPSQLYGPLRLSSGGMTKILKRLEGSELISREPDPEDGRGMRVRLTPRGLSLFDRVVRAYGVASSRFLSGLDESERDEIDAALERLVEQLDPADADTTRREQPTQP